MAGLANDGLDHWSYHRRQQYDRPPPWQRALSNAQL